MLNDFDVSSETIQELKKIYIICDKETFYTACQSTIVQQNAPRNVVEGVRLMVDTLMYKDLADKDFCTRILFKLLHYLHQLGYKDFVYMTEVFIFPYLKHD